MKSDMIPILSNTEWILFDNKLYHLTQVTGSPSTRWYIVTPHV